VAQAPQFIHFTNRISQGTRCNRNSIAELELGRQVRVPQRKKYADATERLQKIVLEYKENGELLDYLGKCGTTFTL